MCPEPSYFWALKPWLFRPLVRTTHRTRGAAPSTTAALRASTLRASPRHTEHHHCQLRSNPLQFGRQSSSLPRSKVKVFLGHCEGAADVSFSSAETTPTLGWTSHQGHRRLRSTATSTLTGRAVAHHITTARSSKIKKPPTRCLKPRGAPTSLRPVQRFLAQPSPDETVHFPAAGPRNPTSAAAFRAVSHVKKLHHCQRPACCDCCHRDHQGVVRDMLQWSCERLAVCPTGAVHGPRQRLQAHQPGPA